MFYLLLLIISIDSQKQSFSIQQRPPGLRSLSRGTPTLYPTEKLNSARETFTRDALNGRLPTGWHYRERERVGLEHRTTGPTKSWMGYRRISAIGIGIIGLKIHNIVLHYTVHNYCTLVIWFVILVSILLFYFILFYTYRKPRNRSLGWRV